MASFSYIPKGVENDDEKDKKAEGIKYHILPKPSVRRGVQK
jgi:hypothetical protein